MQDQQQVLEAFHDIYEKINFYGVYVKYEYCIKKLMALLRLTDPAELHYVMMHLNRLSCINNRYGRYLWSSRRYAELHGFLDEGAISAHLDADLYTVEVVSQLDQMREMAFHLNEVSSALIRVELAANPKFSSHVKVYPIYDQAGQVIASLTVLAEIVSRHTIMKPASPANIEMIRPAGGKSLDKVLQGL